MTARNVTPSTLCLLALALVGPLGLQPRAANAQITLGQQTLGPFPVGGREVTVALEQARITRPGEQVSRALTVSSVRVLDEDGHVHFERGFDYEVGPDGFVDWMEVEVSTLEASDGTALMLDYSVYPSAPGTGETRQLLAWQDGRLRPLSDPIAFFGRFMRLPEGSLPNSVRLLPGDIMPLRHSTHYYTVGVPLHVSLAPLGEGEFAHLRLEPEIDARSRLAMLDVSDVYRWFPEGEEREVTLYRAPAGDQAQRVTVSSASELEFGPAYAEVGLKRSGAGTLRVSVEVRRLRVVIDGKQGFVEESDYENLGLSFAG